MMNDDLKYLLGDEVEVLATQYAPPEEPEEDEVVIVLEDLVADLDWVWDRDRRSMSRAGLVRFDRVRQALKRILEAS